MIRAVFDTVVFVRALINPHGLWGRLVFQHAEQYRLFLSAPVAREILEVLHRPELTRKFRPLEHLDVAQVLAILEQAEVVEPQEMAPRSRDPKDDKFLATALAASAEYLVSEDQDLLVLRVINGTQIVDGLQFLQVLQRLRRGGPDEP